MDNPKIIAFYLPQYHPIPENDAWWGKGFTEWTNVARAERLYKGHYQPKIPKDLGFYDLRVPETRYKQANLAKEAGVTGFCFWHYWFSGKQLMERVFNEILADSNYTFPFCLCWANHSWYAKNWNIKDSKRQHKLLIEQTYKGVEDYESHFYKLLPAFKDKRYIKIDGKPLFGIYDALFNDAQLFIDLWNKLAQENGFSGFYFYTYSCNLDHYKKVKHIKTDEHVVDVMNLAEHKNKSNSLWRRALSKFNFDNLLTLRLTDYTLYIQKAVEFYEKYPDASICILPNYDHSPRSGKNALIFYNSDPDKWEKLLINIKGILEARKKNNKLLFLKSWNEWGEGNYLEPDMKYGSAFLDKIKKVFK